MRKILDFHDTNLFKRLVDIGLSLSSKKNITEILVMILNEAMELTHADGGTLYLADENTHELKFKIIANKTLKIFQGGVEGEEINLPPVQLLINGEPNYANVSAYAANTGKKVNIPDVYHSDKFDFTGPKKYDEMTGYRSKSMLVIPMKNHEDEIIGVLQLINAIDPDHKTVIAFDIKEEDIVSSLASQAAIALTKNQLIQNLESLLYSFIKSIAAAIDAKSKFTTKHITRVVKLTEMIIQAVNENKEGKYKDIKFDGEELKKLTLSAWLHDVGKITTPEYIMDKATKLSKVCDRIEIIKNRFEMLIAKTENQILKQKIALLQKNNLNNEEIEKLDKKQQAIVNQMRDDLDFLQSINHPTEFLTDDKLARLTQIYQSKFTNEQETQHYITQDEFDNLSVRKGTFTPCERKIMEDHAQRSFDILKQLKFPKKFHDIPEIAASHHEKLDGSGYPRHLKENQITLETRMITIADIFEALTAPDRPYKKPMKLSIALKILNSSILILHSLLIQYLSL